MFYILLTILVVYFGRRLYRELNRGRNFHKPSADKHVLITGATSGIGLALAKHMYEAGFSVIATYFTDREPGYAELKNIIENSERTTKRDCNRLHLVSLDVSKKDSIQQLYKVVNTILADASIVNANLWALINNAAIGIDARMHWIHYDQLELIVKTNLIGPLAICQQFMPLLIKSQGRVVNVSSVLSQVWPIGCGLYGATKAGLLHASRIIHKEVRRFGVRVVTILPGNYMDKTNIVTMKAHHWRDEWLAMDPVQRALYEREFRRPFREIEATLGLRWDASKKEFVNVSTNIRDFKPTNMSGTGIEAPFMRALCDREPSSRVAIGQWYYRVLVEIPEAITCQIYRLTEGIIRGAIERQLDAKTS